MEFDFKGLPQLLKRFPDDASARHYLETKRWNGTPICPFCGSDKWYKLAGGKLYKCGNRKCHKKYSVLVGTLFQGSQIPLNVWFAGLYLVGSHKKGISSHQLSKDLGITQKSAWHMLHRLREMMRVKEHITLEGIVEADETYMGRKFKPERKPYDFDHAPTWPQIQDKGCVFGMIERKGQVIVKVFPANTKKDIHEAIHKSVKKDSTLYTDGSHLYKSGFESFKQDSVIHSRREYVRGDVHTNNIENFWGIMKRGIYGIYHQVSYKHLQRYCDEFSYRFNSRKIKDNDRFATILSNPVGRLKYKQLIFNPPSEADIQMNRRWKG